MKCKQRNCNNIVNVTSQKPNKQYCTRYCARQEANLNKSDASLQKLKDKYSVKEEVVINNDKDCRYCKDSSHADFCCDVHRIEYNIIMSQVNAALGR